MTRKDTVALLVLSVIWGSSYLFIAFAAESLPPMTLVAIRLLIGAASLQILLRMRGVRLPREARTLAALAFMGLFNNVIPFTLITWAESPGAQQISSGLAALLIGSAPIFTVIIANFALRDERFTFMRVTGVLIGFVGVLVLVSPTLDGSGGEQSLGGAVATLVASISYAVAITFSRRYLGHIKPIVIGAMQMTFSTLFLIPAALLIEQPQLAAAPARAWYSLLWLGLLGSGIAYVLFFGLIQNIGATRTSIVTYISPGISLILGVVFNGESLHWTLLAGLVLIIGGAIIVNRRMTPSSATRIEALRGTAR
jgi:drug/metabolite transporter (DMT)-like permease